MVDRMTTGFLTDSRYGAVCWPIMTGLSLYRADVVMVLISAFFAGVSVWRWVQLSNEAHEDET